MVIVVVVGIFLEFPPKLEAFGYLQAGSKIKEPIY